MQKIRYSNTDFAVFHNMISVNVTQQKPFAFHRRHNMTKQSSSIDTCCVR